MLRVNWKVVFIIVRKSFIRFFGQNFILSSFIRISFYVLSFSIFYSIGKIGTWFDLF